MSEKLDATELWMQTRIREIGLTPSSDQNYKENETQDIKLIQKRKSQRSYSHHHHPTAMYCISTDVVEQELFPVIADENIDPASLNRKVAYGFTDWLSKMDVRMLKEVQAKQRQVLMKKGQSEYEAGVLRELNSKEQKHLLGRHSFIEYRVKNCQSRQKRWRQIKENNDHLALKQEVLKQMKQDDYLANQQIFFDSTNNNNNNNTNYKIQFNNGMIQKNIPSSKQRPSTSSMTTTTNFNPLISPADVIHQLPTKTRYSSLLRPSTKQNASRNNSQQTNTTPNNMHNSQEINSPGAPGDLQIKQLQNYVASTSSQPSKQGQRDINSRQTARIDQQHQHQQQQIQQQQVVVSEPREYHNNKYEDDISQKQQYSQLFDYARNQTRNTSRTPDNIFIEETNTKPSRGSISNISNNNNNNNTNQRVITGGSNNTKTNESKVYYYNPQNTQINQPLRRSVSPGIVIGEMNQSRMEQRKLSYEKRRTKCLNYVFQTKINQVKQDEVLTGEMRKQKLYDLVKRKRPATKSYDFKLQATFS